MTIRETCSCGAKVIVTCGTDAFARGDASKAVEGFREAHWPCRNNVVHHEGSGGMLPLIIGNEVSP